MENLDREERLLARLRKGDKGAFDDLFRRYYAPLCVHASRYVEDAEAENIVQDVFLYLWENRMRIEISTSLRSYLFTSVRNRALTFLGRSRTKDKVLSYLLYSMDSYCTPSAGQETELSTRLGEAMQSLPAEVQDAFAQSRFEGKTYREIADSAGVSVKVIDHRIQRAVKHLRQALAGLLPEPYL
jgi:RNA polymerase sigma-70 factor (ECF subfamily)